MKNIKTVLLHTFAIFFLIIAISPFLITLLVSLMPSSAMGDPSLSAITLENYSYILLNFPFVRWFFNSLLVASIVTLGNVIINSMGAYALSRFEFKGNKIIFTIVLMGIMIPSQVLLVPTYILLVNLGWINTYLGLTVPFLFNLMYIFLLRQYFMSIPTSLEEAAIIDGYSEFKIFYKIALPVAKVPIITQAILIFTANWNSFMWPSLIATSEAMYTLPVGLNSFYGQYSQYWNSVMAGVVLLTVPAVIIFFVFSRFITKGAITSGIKE